MQYTRGKNPNSNHNGFKIGHKTNVGRIYNPSRNRKISEANKGKIMSLESRLKLSKSIKGKHHSPATEFKKGQVSGCKNPHWKGGITPINAKIRNSIEYQNWRKSVFERDNYTCVWCGEKGGRLNTDHIKSFALFPELHFVVANGRTLCEFCHKTTESYLSNRYNPEIVRINQFRKKMYQIGREELLKEINNLIAEEMLICNTEHQPTSRLTSLAVKIKNLK